MCLANANRLVKCLKKPVGPPGGSWAASPTSGLFCVPMHWRIGQVAGGWLEKPPPRQASDEAMKHA